MRKFIAISVLWFVVAGIAFGHGFGQTLEKAVGEYAIDVDYDVEALVAGELVRFNLNIWNEDRTEQVAFDDVWARIAPQAGGISFAGSFSRPQVGSAGFSYAFPRPGAYDLSVRFQKGGEQIVEEVSLPLTVGEVKAREGGGSTDVVVGGILGLLVGVLIGFFLKKRSAV
ncbi:MAG: hypothetical protein A3J67_01890 [Parcubacteria group bacterium RIFCSPHIGHO2_02_FULL_48_10b]|nr:MAG: hypothetical protein A3J67_01890 [Parcubacteria group bacterium RIFCSPHIGHO2_02_FULL_48_10b]